MLQPFLQNMGLSQNEGYLFAGTYIKDSITFVSAWRSPTYGNYLKVKDVVHKDLCLPQENLNKARAGFGFGLQGPFFLVVLWGLHIGIQVMQSKSSLPTHS